MKSRLIKVILMGILSVSCITGCGKKEAVVEEVKVEESKPVSIQETKKVEEETQPTKPEFEKSEKAKIWNSVTTKVEDRWIQIDDIMYTPGVKISDIVEKAKSSEIQYESDYVEDRLVSANDSATITFKREGFDWFLIHTVNGFGETKSIKDLPVTGISIAEEAKPYCHFGAGFAGSDVLGMSYNDIKGACEAGLSDWTYKEETVWKNEADCLAMTYYSPYEHSVLPNAEWTGYEINVGEIAYTFFINSSTGKVVDFEANNGIGEALWNPIIEDASDSEITSVSENSIEEDKDSQESDGQQEETVTEKDAETKD